MSDLKLVLELVNLSEDEFKAIQRDATKTAEVFQKATDAMQKQGVDTFRDISREAETFTDRTTANVDRLTRQTKILEDRSRALTGAYRLARRQARPLGEEAKAALDKARFAAEDARVALADMRRQLRDARRESRDLSEGFDTLAVGAGAITVGLGLTVKSATEAAIKFERLQAGLTAVVGNADEARQRFEQLQTVAEAPGLALEQAVQGAIRLQATGLSAQFADRALRALGNAVATVGGDRGNLEAAIRAIEQIQSKGQLSAEEIRQQLGDAIGITGRIIKEAFGTTNIDAIRQTGISTTQFLERLISQFETLGSVNNSTFNRVENLRDSFERMQAQLGQALLPTLGDLVEALSGLFNFFSTLPDSIQQLIIRATVAATALSALVAGIGIAAKTIPLLTAGVAALSTALSFLAANPVVLAIAGLTALGTLAFLTKRNIDAAKFSVDDFNKSAEQLGSAISEQEIARARLRLRSMREGIEDTGERIEILTRQLRATQERLREDLPSTSPLNRGIQNQIRQRSEELSALSVQLQRERSAAAQLAASIRRTTGGATTQPGATTPSITPPPDPKILQAQERASKAQIVLIENQFARQRAEVESAFRFRQIKLDQEIQAAQNNKALQQALQAELVAIEAEKAAKLASINKTEADERTKRLGEGLQQFIQAKQAEIQAEQAAIDARNAALESGLQAFIQNRIQQVQAAQRTEGNIRNLTFETQALRIASITDAFDRERGQIALNAGRQAQALRDRLTQEGLTRDEIEAIQNQIAQIGISTAQKIREVTEREQAAEIETRKAARDTQIAIADDIDAQRETNRQKRADRLVAIVQAESDRVKGILTDINEFNQNLGRQTVGFFKDLVRSNRQITDQIVGFGFDLLSIPQRRREVEAQGQQQILDLNERTARQIREIEENKTLSAQRKAQRIEQIERRSAQQRIDIERRVADEQGNIFANLVANFRRQLERLAQQRLAAQALSGIESAAAGGGINFGKVLGGIGGAVIGAFAGNPAIGASIGASLGGQLGNSGITQTLAEVGPAISFDSPINDLRALTAGQVSGRQFGRVQTLALAGARHMGQQSAQDMVVQHQIGFTQGLRQTVVSQEAQTPLGFQGTIRVQLVDDKNKLVKEETIRTNLTRQGRI